ncbi:MAG: nuclear transport factor 2 family protein [Saprospiraceae bacterium]
MKALKMTLTVLALLVSQWINAQQALNEEFQNYLNEVYGAYDQGGWEKLKSYYSPTATEIDPVGMINSGLSQLDAYYKNFDALLEGKPSFTNRIKSAKLIGRDVALIIWESTGEFKINGETLKNSGTTSAVLVKKDGQWLIEQTQLTPVRTGDENH